MKFVFHNPTKIYFGQGQIASIGAEIPEDKRVLVLYGGGSIKKNGIYDQVVAALAGHAWSEFSGIESNPCVETLDHAVVQGRKEGVEYLMAVGGGSVIDAAKYVAAALCYEGEGWDILTGKHKVTRALPLGAILTIPATGSESNPTSVIGKKATREKLFFSSPAVHPRFAVLDPDAIKTLPKRQLANGIVDAWVHTCEQYLTTDKNTPVQNGYAEALLKTLYQLGQQFDAQDDAWRANLMWAANQALNGLIGVGVDQDWATHMIGHEITALFGLDHARSLAVVQPALLRHEVARKRAKLERMGREVFGLSGDALAERTIDAIEAFYHRLDVATQLTAHEGDREAAIKAILAQLEKHRMVALGEHRAIRLPQIREILENVVA